MQSATSRAVPITKTFGREFADELAAWAMDVLMSENVPADRHRYAYAVKVPWSDFQAGREILEGAGIDWREIHGKRVATRRARDRAAEERRRGEKETAGP